MKSKRRKSEMLTPDEVAATLGCERHKVTELIVSGRLPAINFASPGSYANRFRVSRRVLERIMIEGSM